MTTFAIQIFKRSLSDARMLKIYFPLLIFSLGVLLRFFYAFNGPLLEKESWSDMRIYLKISKFIEMGVWKETHFFQSIGYPLILYAVKQAVSLLSQAVSLLQAFASSLTLFFFYRMVSESFPHRVAFISFFIGVFHVPWILYGNFALPETFFTLFISITAYSSLRIVKSIRVGYFWPAVWALAFIFAFWLKGTHALWGPLFLLCLFLLKRKKSLPAIMIIGSIVGAGLGAHGLLTYSKTGKVQLSASTGGLNFVEGKCPGKKNIDSAGFFWHSPLYFQLDLNRTKKWNRPFTDSGYFMKQGLECIKRDPAVLLLSFEGIPYLFFGNTLWPFNSRPYSRYMRFYELIFSLFLVVGLTTYGLDIFRRRNLEEFTIWVIPALALFLCVYIFKSEMRYRIPFDIFFIPLAVKGWHYFRRGQ
ncbi:MAG: glycosyltransferase family 39 protein [Bacteriovoracia bacterium]